MCHVPVCEAKQVGHILKDESARSAVARKADDFVEEGID
jgi:hypothetical protein